MGMPTRNDRATVPRIVMPNPASGLRTETMVPPGPPDDVRRTISTCRHRWSELKISPPPDARAEGHSCVDKGARGGNTFRAIAWLEESQTSTSELRGPKP